MGKLIIESLSATAVDVPMRRPLVTGGGTVASAPLVLIRIRCGNVEGVSYVFCYSPSILGPMRDLVVSMSQSLIGSAAEPLDIYRTLHGRYRLLGCQGLIAMACAGIDMALWDAVAKSVGVPLCRLLGAAPKQVRAYNSNGLGIIGAEAAAAQAVELLGSQFDAVKVRLGYPTAEEDRSVVESVRAAVGNEVALMADYNQCLSVAEAEQRMRILDDAGLYWVEEPTAADDYPGHARVRNTSRTAIQLGENFWGPTEMKKALDAGCADYLMPDAMKIGGVSGWLQAAALGDTFKVPLSSHLFPEVSLHLLAATPTAHWLEYVDWAEPILSSPVKVENGVAIAGEAPGAGIAFDDEAVARFDVSR